MAVQTKIITHTEFTSLVKHAIKRVADFNNSRMLYVLHDSILEVPTFYNRSTLRHFTQDVKRIPVKKETDFVSRTGKRKI